MRNGGGNLEKEEREEKEGKMAKKEALQRETKDTSNERRSFFFAPYRAKI